MMLIGVFFLEKLEVVTPVIRYENRPEEVIRTP